MYLTFSENPLTGENDIWGIKIPNMEPQWEQTASSFFLTTVFSFL